MAIIVAWCLFALALAHVAFGLSRFRQPLSEAVSAGFVGQFAATPERRTAFWFMIFALPMMLAFAMLAVIRQRANAPTPPKIPVRLARRHQTSSAGRSRRSAASPSVSPSDASGPPTSSPGPSGDEPTRPPRNAHT